MKTDERSRDGSRYRSVPLFQPSQAWIDAFDHQCTVTVLERVRRHAIRWARMLGGDAAADAMEYSRELTQDAVADTCAGVLRWDPQRIELEVHLCDVVRLRARRDRRRDDRYQHISIDTSDPDDAGSALAQAEAALAGAAPATDDQEAELAAVLSGRLVQLRASLSDDPQSLRFVDVLAEIDGELNPASIMQHARLTRSEYINTWRRVARAARNLGAGKRSKEESQS